MENQLYSVAIDSKQNLSFLHSAAKKQNKNIRIGLQTNLIGISDSKLQLFKRYKVDLGGSLDNSDIINDSFRPLAKKAVNILSMGI